MIAVDLRPMEELPVISAQGPSSFAEWGEMFSLAMPSVCDGEDEGREQSSMAVAGIVCARFKRCPIIERSHGLPNHLVSGFCGSSESQSSSRRLAETHVESTCICRI